MSRVYRRGSIDVTKENLPLAEAIEKEQVTIEFLYAPEDNSVIIMYYDMDKVNINDVLNVKNALSIAFPDNEVLGIPFNYCLEEVGTESLITIRDMVNDIIQERTKNG